MNEKSSSLFIGILRLRMAAGLDTSAQLLRTLYYSVMLGNAKLINDRFDRPCAYIVWGSLGKETVRRAFQERKLVIHPEDLNEGYFNIVLDLFHSDRSSRYLRGLVREMALNSRCLLYFRKGRMMVVKTQLGRARKHHSCPFELMHFAGK